MPRGKMSPAARAKIAAAQRKRWAKHRAAKAGGTAPTGKKRGRPAGSTTAKRRGRPTMAESVMSLNPFMNVSIHDLVTARRHVEEAWNATLAMLGIGGTAKGKRRRGRRKKK